MRLKQHTVPSRMTGNWGFETETLRLARVQGFGPPTNLFSLLGLPEILVERGDVGMQVRKQLPKLRFLSNDVGFQGDLFLFTSPETLFETLNELNPTFHF